MSILKVNTIQDKGGNAIISSDGSGTLTLPSDLKNTPAFLAKKSSDQTISSSTTTLITWDSVSYDTNSAFSNNRFTVPSGCGGKYLINCVMDLGGGSANTYFMNEIFVNNSLTQYTIQRFSGTGDTYNNNTTFLDLSAGDYVTVKILHNTGSNETLYYNKLSWFGGFRIIGA